MSDNIKQISSLPHDQSIQINNRDDIILQHQCYLTRPHNTETVKRVAENEVH